MALVFSVPGISDLITLVGEVKKWKMVKKYRQRLSLLQNKLVVLLIGLWKRHAVRCMKWLAGQRLYCHPGPRSQPLQAKKQISRALKITKLRKVEYKIRLQIYILTVIKRIVIMVTATIS